MSRDVILQKLREEGYRITNQRRLIIDTILANDCSCCKEIYYQALKKDKNVGIATVYRMVNALADLGVFQANVPWRLTGAASSGGQDGCRVVLKNRTVVELDRHEWQSLLEDALRKKGYTEALELERVIL